LRIKTTSSWHNIGISCHNQSLIYVTIFLAQAHNKPQFHKKRLDNEWLRIKKLGNIQDFIHQNLLFQIN
jgi:hypothetical protein